MSDLTQNVNIAVNVAGSEKLREVAAAMREAFAGSQYANAAGSLNQLTAAAKAAGAALGNLGSPTGGAGQSRSMFDGLVSSVGKFNILVRGVENAVKIANMAFDGAIRPAVEFEKAMSGLAKVAEGEVSKNLPKMAKVFLDLSEKIPLSAKALAGIGESAAAAGINTVSGLTASTETIAKFSVAVGMEATKAADSLFQVAAAFGKDPSKDTNILNVIASQLTSTGAAIVGGANELTTAITHIPNAMKVGLSTGAVTAFAGALINAGETGANTANILRVTFQKMSAEPSKFAHAMGMSADEVRAALAGGENSTIGLLQKAAGSMAKMAAGSVELEAASKDLGRPAALGLQKLGGQLVLVNAQLKSNAAQAIDATASNTAFGKATDNLASQWTLFTNSLEKARIEAGTKLLPILKDLLDQARPLIPTFASLADTIGTGLGNVMSVAANFKDVFAVAVDIAKGAWEKFASGMDTGFGTIIDIFKGAGDLIGKFAIGVGIAMKGVLWTFEAGWKIVDTITFGLLNGIVGKVKDAMVAFVTPFSDAFGFIGDALTNFVKKFEIYVFKTGEGGKAVAEFSRQQEMAAKRGLVLDEATGKLVTSTGQFVNKVQLGSQEVKGMTASVDAGKSATNKYDEAFLNATRSVHGAGEAMDGTNTKAGLLKKVKMDLANMTAEFAQGQAAETITLMQAKQAYNFAQEKLKELQIEKHHARKEDKAGFDAAIMEAEKLVVQTKSQVDSTKNVISTNKMLHASYREETKALSDKQVLMAMDEESKKKAAKSDTVLAKAIEANSHIFESRMKFRTAVVESFASVMKSQFEASAKIAEANARAIEASMKSLGDSTNKTIDLMITGWGDYVKAVQNPFGAGSSKIVSSFDQQAALMRELILSQTRLAREQAESMRFQREKQSANKPMVIHTVVEGGDNAIMELVSQVIAQITTRMISENGWLCCN